MAVIEVKLARNSEARRAVVARVLTYAAFLHGMDVATLERDVLGRQLRDRGYDSLAGAISADDQEGAFESEEFAAALTANLATGAFRLVLVLDDAPDELVRLVGLPRSSRRSARHRFGYGHRVRRRRHADHGPPTR